MHTLHTPARAVLACTQVELYRDYLTELARRGFDNLSAGGDRVSISTPRKVWATLRALAKVLRPEPATWTFCAAAPPGARPGGERRVASEPPGRAPGGSAEHLWLGAGAGARKKEISVVGPTQRLRSAKAAKEQARENAAASGRGHLAKS